MHGEYIALGSLESKYSHCTLIDNICVVGDSHHGAPIALIAPNHPKILALAKDMGIDADIEAVCANPEIVKAVLKQLAALAAEKKLEKVRKRGHEKQRTGHRHDEA